MLANGEKGFAVGELHALMRPWRPHHLLRSKGCFCNKTGCTFWREAANAGVKDIYSRIFELNNDINFIVDSSKNYLWIKDQIKYGKNKNYKIIPLIIYKNPVEYAYSRYKRSSLDNWKYTWIQKHKTLFGLFDNFVSVNFKELALNPEEKIKSLCKALDIPYFKGKKDFWKNDQLHILFGSNTAKSSDKLIPYNEKNFDDRFNRLKENLNLNDPVLNNVLKILDAYEVDRKEKKDLLTVDLKKELSDDLAFTNMLNRFRATPYYAMNRAVNILLGYVK